MGLSLSKNSKAQKHTRKPEPQANPAVNGGTIQNGFGKPYRDVSELSNALNFFEYINISCVA